jgi:hypothetical protein
MSSRLRRSRLEGTLTREVFLGPPNYRDIRKGDKPELAYILRLSKPICVSGDEFIDPKRKIDRVQMFGIGRQGAGFVERTPQAGRQIGERRRAEPFGAHTGHHHAPLLLPIAKIAAAKPRPTR